MTDPEQKDEGREVLDIVWFTVFDELWDIVVDERADAGDRISACDVLLKYFIAMGQSINAPYVPTKRPVEEDEDE